MRKTLFAAAAALVLAGNGAQAQTWPTRPITMIVPFAAGGPTDIVARIVGEHMSRTLGQQIVVENVAGAGGTTGITRAKQATPDGYTIAMGHMGTHGAAPALYPNLRYDPAKDFEPIGLAAGTPILIVTKKDFPASNLKEFIDHVKANGAKLNEAHAGVGSVSHTTCTLLQSIIGAKFTRVAYRGTGPALNDLVGGQVDFSCDQIVNLVPQIQAGTIKAIAIATPERSPSLPDVPTTKEAGLPEYEVSRLERGVRAEGHAEGDHREARRRARQGALRRQHAQAPARARRRHPGRRGRGPQALQKLVESEVARWTPVLKAAGVTAQ